MPKRRSLFTVLSPFVDLPDPSDVAHATFGAVLLGADEFAEYVPFVQDRKAKVLEELTYIFADWFCVPDPGMGSGISAELSTIHPTG